MADPAFQPMPFPARGLHAAGEVAVQPDLTTPVAVNVRLVNPGTLRSRGGSRAGLSRFIDDRTAAAEVQDLGSVVTASENALPWASPSFDPYGTEGTDWVTDPTDNPPGTPTGGLEERNPDPPRRLPPGGDGYPPDRHTSVPPIARDDAATCETDGGTATADVLANDDYLGTPTLSVSAGPNHSGSTASVTGTGASSRIVYTAASGVETYADEVEYTLLGSGNTGSSRARVAVNVVGVGEGGSGGWEFVQKKSFDTPIDFATITRTDQVTFDSATELNQMIVVLLYGNTDYDGPNFYNPTIVVTDSLGNTYTEMRYEVDSYNSAPFTQGKDFCYVAWTRNAAGGACTVNVQQTSTAGSGQLVGSADIVILEYRGLQTSTPEDGDVGDSAISASPTGTMSPGAVPIGGQTRLVLGFFGAYCAGTDTYTMPAGWTARHNATGGNDVRIVVLEELSSGASETPTADYDHTPSPLAEVFWVALGAGWRYR